MTYMIRITDRNTKKIVQEETRKSLRAADNLWCRALKNVNSLKYKMEFIEIPGRGE